MTKTHNQIGADQFCTVLCDQNKTILRTQFEPESIKKFIDSSERGSETPRLLKLLSAICSCKGVPIIEN